MPCRNSADLKSLKNRRKVLGGPPVLTAFQNRRILALPRFFLWEVGDRSGAGDPKNLGIGSK